MMYAVDWDEKMPPPRAWTPAIYPYIQRNYELLECPAAPGRWGYAMNSRVAGMSLMQIRQPAQTFLLFDSSWNGRSATLDTRWIAYRHMNGANVARADGSTRWYASGQRPQ